MFSLCPLIEIPNVTKMAAGRFHNGFFIFSQLFYETLISGNKFVIIFRKIKPKKPEQDYHHTLCIWWMSVDKYHAKHLSIGKVQKTKSKWRIIVSGQYYTGGNCRLTRTIPS